MSCFCDFKLKFIEGPHAFVNIHVLKTVVRQINGCVYIPTYDAI